MVKGTPGQKPEAGSQKPLLAGFVVAVLLAGVAWWTFGDALSVRPLGGDNLYVLSWANRTGPRGLLQVDPVIYPEWRPLAYATVWLQFQWARLDAVAWYHGVNIALWAACAWFIWAIVRHVTQSTMAGLIAALAVLTDVRAITAQTLIVERQTSMAVLFGFAAIWFVIRRRNARLSWNGVAVVALLCLASAFSKEYGIAVAGAIALCGLIDKRRDLLVAAASACAIYAVARLSVAGGANDLYCEYMGYFFTVRKVCYAGFDATTAGQMTYNVAASAVGTLLPGALTADGQIGFAPLRLLVSLGWLTLAWLGWRRGTWLGRLAAFVIAGNTALSFMVYGGRNQMIGVCALGLVIGLGVDALIRWQPDDGTVPRILQFAAAAAIVTVIGGNAWLTKREAAQQIVALLGQDPCSEILHPDQHDPALIHEIKLKYDMPDPECAAR